MTKIHDFAIDVLCFLVIDKKFIFGLFWKNIIVFVKPSFMQLWAMQLYEVKVNDLTKFCGLYAPNKFCGLYAPMSNVLALLSNYYAELW